MVEIFMESSIQDPEALLAADVDGKSIDLSLLAQIERDLVLCLVIQLLTHCLLSW